MPRRLTLEDLEALLAFEREPPLAVAADGLAGVLADLDLCLLGDWKNGCLAGYALVARLPFEAELQALRVAPSWRRRGIAGSLLAAALAQARVWGSERLQLEVRAGNRGAVALYEQAGWRLDGRRRGYYPPRLPGAGREDALLMSCPLA
jgi:[ribosomal protein S18]-alanine N-acetyltransferase